MTKKQSNTEILNDLIVALNNQVIRARKSQTSGDLADFDFNTCDKKVSEILSSDIEIKEIFGNLILTLSNLEIINKLVKDLNSDLGKNKIKLIEKFTQKSKLLLDEIKLNLNEEGTIN